MFSSGFPPTYVRLATIPLPILQVNDSDGTFDNKRRATYLSAGRCCGESRHQTKDSPFIAGD